MRKNTRLKDITTSKIFDVIKTKTFRYNLSDKLREYSLECKGCISQELELKLGPNQTNFCLDYLSLDCPCQTCLVKVTCTHFCDKVIRKLKEHGMFVV